MKFLTSKQLDCNRMDNLIASGSKNNVFCYSWYLSATSDEWGAIVDDAYTFVFPFPYKNRILFKQYFQHPFSRNLDFFGDERLLPKAVEIMQSFVKFRIHFSGELPFKQSKRIFQSINLQNEINYKKNAIRILSKNENKYQFKFTTNFHIVLNFYLENSFNKIKQQAKNKLFLKQLFEQALLHNKGECLEVWEGETCVAAAFFLMDKQTVCYLIGDSNATHKKEGVMFSLMDKAINHYKSSFEIFDFGGSSIESVATFYHKLGGVDQEYFEYKK